jgi:hypothetical protein
MDYIYLSCKRYSLKQVRYRIIKTVDDESSGDGSMITLTVEEALEGISHGGEHASATGEGFIPNYSGVPASINEPIVFVAPNKLAQTSGEIWMGISNSDPLYGGCDIYLSYDNSTYKRIATHTKNAITGRVTNHFNNGASVLSVDLTESKGQLDSFTQTAFDLYDSLCRVGNELIAYRDITLTGNNNYDLKVFHRGLYGSTIGAEINSQFVLCDDNLFKTWFKDNLVNTTIYLKFVSFNYFGTGYEDISTLPYYSFTVDSNGRAVIDKTAAFTYYQNTPEQTWTINHNLSRPVSVETYDSNGQLMRGVPKQIKNSSGNYMTITVHFSKPVAGLAIIN